MRAASRLNRILLATLIFTAGAVTGQFASPLWKYGLTVSAQPRYQELTYACDRAMRDHMIAKQQVIRRPGKDTVAILNAAEVALLDCQDYDLMRKRLIQWGLDDNDLSLMALRAIEAKARDLQQVIEIHEIRY